MASPQRHRIHRFSGDTSADFEYARSNAAQCVEQYVDVQGLGPAVHRLSM